MYERYWKIYELKIDSIIKLNVDTKYDTTYNIYRRYSECQNGINY